MIFIQIENFEHFLKIKSWLCYWSDKLFIDFINVIKDICILSLNLLCLTEWSTEGEFERRQRLIDTLTSKKVQIDDAFSGKEEGGSR